MFTKRSILAALAAPSLTLAGPVFHTIALSGDPAPGLPGIKFDYLSDARIGDGGTILFWADLSGAPVTAGSIWSTRSGSLALLYREGDPTGLSPTSVWAAFPSPCMNADGQVAFTGSLADTAAPNNPINLGIFSENASLQLQKLAREGEPTTTTGNWASLPQTQLSDIGITTFFANQSIWVAASPPPVPLVSNGSPAPGGLTFDSLGPPSQGLPHFAFRATLRDGAAGSQPIASGLWTSTTTGLALLARSESPAPATPFGFADFLNSPTLHGSTVTFWARLSGLGTGLGSNEAIYSGTPGSLTLKVLEGAQAAGCPAGTLHLGLTRIPAAAASGAIAFGSLLAGPGITTNNDSGIWSISPAGAITLLAREGDQAPRLPAGTLYAGFEGPSISNSGRIIILARLRGPGVTSANNRALLVTDPTGRIYPILRTGDTFGAPRLIDEIVFDHGQPQSGRTALLDDAPDLTLALKLILRDRYQPPASGYSHAIITASLGCLADMDGDGLITVNDFMRFLLYFNSNNLRACDFSGNGVLDVTDFIGFINAVNTPCP